ncbi:unnamed protein product [Urochloa decumbens]|uniref:Germin-like protein n=1 Tax=Urochloa decumbens TaxID=240449 RepID=A0ABC9BIU4_9POAL
MAKASVPVLLLLLLLSPLLSSLPFYSHALESQDFCVANLLLPSTPSGYQCKPNLLVTAADFHSDALAKPGQLVAPFNTSFAGATVKQFPGVNGLGLAATRLDVRVGGVMPLHAHPEASQLLIVVKGALSASFISAADTNKVYTKEVREGEIFVFPQGLLHFHYNIGSETAVAFSAYSSSNPGLQIADYALFGNLLPADVVEKVTFIKEAEVKRLKAFFGL